VLLNASKDATFYTSAAIGLTASAITAKPSVRPEELSSVGIDLKEMGGQLPKC